MALIDLRTPDNPSEPSRDNFNINIIKTAADNLPNVFTDIIETLSEAADFKLIDKGDTTINDIPFKLIRCDTKISGNLPSVIATINLPLRRTIHRLVILFNETRTSQLKNKWSQWLHMLDFNDFPSSGHHTYISLPVTELKAAKTQ